MLAFRKKIYTSLDEIQADLDKWLEYYNTARPHQGKRQQGRTPMETFMDNLSYAKQKISCMNDLEFVIENELTVTI